MGMAVFHAVCLCVLPRLIVDYFFSLVFMLIWSKIFFLVNCK